jgi:methylenetetrahydrofolate dehydrogenase (NADP+)/methenyltetrahydrofolate cyclohydrolase
MQTQIIDGKKLRDEILIKLKKEVANLTFQPVFCDVLVGEDPVSKQYVEMKASFAETIGIHFHHASFPTTITTEDLIKEIKILNKIPNMCGLIVQLPLPASLDQSKVLNSIDPEIDVDCLGEIASEKFFNNQTDIGRPTAVSCMKLLDSVNLDLKNKKILILGQGELVGRPVTALMKFRGLNPDIAVKETTNQAELMKQADVIISGTGHGKLITGDKIKKGVVIIDAGTSKVNGKIIGDVDRESVQGIASFISPVPGGVGPMTVAILLSNVLQVAKSRALMDGARHDFAKSNE